MLHTKLLGERSFTLAFFSKALSGSVAEIQPAEAVNLIRPCGIETCLFDDAALYRLTSEMVSGLPVHAGIIVRQVWSLLALSYAVRNHAVCECLEFLCTYRPPLRKDTIICSFRNSADFASPRVVG
jgi:hypothetical protein